MTPRCILRATQWRGLNNARHHTDNELRIKRKGIMCNLAKQERLFLHISNSMYRDNDCRVFAYLGSDGHLKRRDIRRCSVRAQFHAHCAPLSRA